MIDLNDWMGLSKSFCICNKCKTELEAKTKHRLKSECLQEKVTFFPRETKPFFFLLTL